MSQTARTNLPSYRFHRPSGQAVRLNDRDFYLGPWQTEKSKAEYERIIGERLASNRRVPSATQDDKANLTVGELLSAFLEYAKVYCQRDGKVTREVEHLKLAMRLVAEPYAPAADGDAAGGGDDHAGLRRGHDGWGVALPAERAQDDAPRPRADRRPRAAGTSHREAVPEGRSAGLPVQLEGVRGGTRPTGRTTRPQRQIRPPSRRLPRETASRLAAAYSC